jgi:hypothetical protein
MIIVVTDIDETESNYTENNFEKELIKQFLRAKFSTSLFFSQQVHCWLKMDNKMFIH